MAHLKSYDEQMGGFDLSLAQRYRSPIFKELSSSREESYPAHLS